MNFYNDMPGQAGCKQCGPTSQSFGYATTCECLGANRAFIKSLGACLCKQGYKPKNDKPNIDSAEDCEAIITGVCPPDQDVDLLGQCIDKAQQDEVCSKQCAPGVKGTIIPGTGLCECEKQNDILEVCDSTCQKSLQKSSLDANGKLTVYDPVTGITKTIDPSQ